MKGTCTRSPCEYWHPPECQFYQNETSCKAGDPHYKVDAQPNKKPKKSCFPKRRESHDKNVVAVVKLYHNWVASRKTRMRWILTEENKPGKSNAKRLGTDSKSTVHSVHASASKLLGIERTMAGKNKSQKSSSAKSLRHEIGGPVPKQGTRLHSTLPRRNGYWLHQQKSRRKERLWWIPELVCIWSVKENSTLPHWRP